MKRILMFFFMGIFCIYTFGIEPKTQSITGLKLEFQVCITDKQAGGHIKPLAPIAKPTVSIDQKTLYFYNVGYDLTVELLDEEENVVYSVFVPAETTDVSLPDDLDGDYEIRLQTGGNFYFMSYITL